MMIIRYWWHTPLMPCLGATARGLSQLDVGISVSWVQSYCFLQVLYSLPWH